MNPSYDTRSLLRITTAGSVDDGKSTLIGRLLYEAKALFDDHLAAIENQKRIDGELDLSLITDGLKSEREQGITIDVAYRYFATARRKYILADAPGHIQYTRNMVTAASLANTAILLVDARQGIVEQTKRHAYLIHLLKVNHVILAINKIDLIDYDQNRIQRIEKDFRNLNWNLDSSSSLTVIPVSALKGDNISQQSLKTPWYQGLPLMQLLDELPDITPLSDEWQLPIQLILREPKGQRLACGTLRKGILEVGDRVKVYPSQQQSRIAKLYVSGKLAKRAIEGQAIAIALEDEIDLERGDFLTPKEQAWVKSSAVKVDLIWFDDEPLDGRKRYLLKAGTQTSRAWVEEIDYRFDLANLTQVVADHLKANDIARVGLTLAKPIFFDTFANDTASGILILIDPETNRTVAAGLIVNLTSSNSRVSEDLRRIKIVSSLQSLETLDSTTVIQLPKSFLAVNSMMNQRRLVETLHNLGWHIHLESSHDAETLKRQLLEQGYETYHDGLGI